MAQLAAALRGPFRQAARGGAVSVAGSRFRSVNNHLVSTEKRNFLHSHHQPVGIQTAGTYLRGLQLCTKAAAPGATQAATQGAARGTAWVAAPQVTQQTGGWWWSFVWSVSGLSIGIGATLTGVAMFFDSRRNELAHVNNQLSKLYGPLYGNRQAARRIYNKAVSKSFYGEKGPGSLKEYLEEAKCKWQSKDEQKKDRGRSMLTRWRRFLLTIIHPLDRQAEEIIRENAHLIEDSETKAEMFSKFVFHVNYERFIVDKWKDRDFVVAFQEQYRDKDFDPWQNSGKFDEDTADSNQMLLDLEKHVDETYQKLVKRQKHLMDGPIKSRFF